MGDLQPTTRSAWKKSVGLCRRYPAAFPIPWSHHVKIAKWRIFLRYESLAKLYHKETGSDYLERVLQQPSNRSMISPLSIVEMESVSAIKVRSDQLDNSGMVIVRRRLRADLAQRRIWSLHQCRKNIFMVH